MIAHTNKRFTCQPALYLAQTRHRLACLTTLILNKKPGNKIKRERQPRITSHKIPDQQPILFHFFTGASRIYLEQNHHHSFLRFACARLLADRFPPPFPSPQATRRNLEACEEQMSTVRHLNWANARMRNATASSRASEREITAVRI